MPKHYIITSTDENPLYYTFLPTIYQMWKNHIPDCHIVVGYIGNKTTDDKFVQRLGMFCDELASFPHIENMHPGCQAKTTRLFLASSYPNAICTIVDIDQYLLDFQWFKQKTAPALNNNKFISIGHNHYFGTQHVGKFPMSFTTASGQIWKKIVNRQNLQYYQWFKHISNLPNPIDNKENPSNPFNKFSDESLLRYLLERHPDQDFIKSVWVKQEREDEIWGRMKCSRRVDRGYWREFKPELLAKNYYIDSQPLRPFHKYFNYLVPLLNYMGIKGNKDQLFF